MQTNSAGKGGATPAQMGPLSQAPITATRPMPLGPMQGPVPLSPVSQMLPGGGAGGGQNAQAAMQAAMAGRPVAPTLPQQGPGLLGAQPSGQSAPANSGGGGLASVFSRLDPQTMQKLSALFGG